MVSQLFSLTPLDAVKKIQSDFGIADVEFDKEKYKKEYNIKTKQLLKEKEFESWKHNTYLLLTEYCSLLRKWREKFLAEHGLKDYFRKIFIHSNNQEL